MRWPGKKNIAKVIVNVVREMKEGVGVDKNNGIQSSN